MVATNSHPFCDDIILTSKVVINRFAPAISDPIATSAIAQPPTVDRFSKAELAIFREHILDCKKSTSAGVEKPVHY